jgi:hypothetical protein
VFSIEAKIDFYAPLAQAGRCLGQWLEEEGLTLDAASHARASALLARYFHGGEAVTDQLLLSFLRHYSGRRVVDMEDPVSVRREIKDLLDRAVPRPLAVARGRVYAISCASFAALVLALGLWARCPISAEEQVRLKSLVHQVAVADGASTHAAIWAQLKGPLKLRSYQDMSHLDYARSRTILERRLRRAGK